MKATGIVRRIDDLGRLVIPKEIRTTLRIREGDPLEIFVDREGEVILKKYSPIMELGEFAQEYADSLHESTDHIACIADRDVIVAVAGASRQKLEEKAIGQMTERIMEERRTLLVTDHEETQELIQEYTLDFKAAVVAPIITRGDLIGAVLLCTEDPDADMGDLEVKLAETAAGFLAKQMEQ